MYTMNGNPSTNSNNSHPFLDFDPTKSDVSIPAVDEATDTTTTTSTTTAKNPNKNPINHTTNDSALKSNMDVPLESSSMAMMSSVQKLKEANAKYKNLLKLARERIQAQEDELETLRALHSKVDPVGTGTFTTHSKSSLTVGGVAQDSFLSLDYDTVPPVVDGSSYDGLDMQANSSSTMNSNMSQSTTNPMGLNPVCSVLHVCQRIKMETTNTQSTTDLQDNTESVNSNPNARKTCIWALIEYELILPEGTDLSMFPSLLPYSSQLLQLQQPPSTTKQQYPRFRFQRWKRFYCENDLLDHIRRDRGDPIYLPPYSLNPQQSTKIMADAKKAVDAITEEFRKFRIRAEISKKQSEDVVRTLQQSQVQATMDRFATTATGGNAAMTTTTTSTSSTSLPTNHTNQQDWTIQSLQTELKQQEIRWKEAYDDLLAENKKLTSIGSEAVVASQWRHRYEQCCKERDDWKAKVEGYMTQQNGMNFSIVDSSYEYPTHTSSSDDQDATHDMESMSQEEKKNRSTRKGIKDYESKYRDLKESFRLYRKKAKEVFDAQQRGDMTSVTHLLTMESDSHTNNGSATKNMKMDEAKLLYLKNLMIHYLCADESSDVRGPMERAIGTILQFTDSDYDKVHHRKTNSSKGGGSSSGSGSGGAGNSNSMTSSFTGHSWFG